ncbi:hypothetical protein M3J09_010807 [Ascochyta lentis]
MFSDRLDRGSCKTRRVGPTAVVSSGFASWPPQKQWRFVEIRGERSPRCQPRGVMFHPRV